MKFHRFNLSNSSFEEITVNNSNLEGKSMDLEYSEEEYGYSLEDWSQKLGFGKKKTLKYIKTQINNGKGRVVRVPIIDITGRVNYSYVYVLKLESDGNKE